MILGFPSPPRARTPHDGLHPLVRTMIERCPSRTDALRAALMAHMLPPNTEPDIVQSGYSIFMKTFGPCPRPYQDRGTALEAAFRPMLAHALDLLDALPPKLAFQTTKDAEHIVQTYVTVHWTVGARAAAMALYDGVT